MTDEERARAIEIELELRRRITAPVAQPAAQPAAIQQPLIRMPAPSGATQAAQEMEQEWRNQRGPVSPGMAALDQRYANPNATAGERLGLLPQMAWQSAVDAKDMMKSAGVRTAPALALEAVGRRYGGPVGGWGGRVTGAGIGNVLDQFRMMSNDPNYKFSFGNLGGDITNAAMPTQSAVARNPYFQGGTNLVSKAVETGIDEHRLPNKEEFVATVGSGLASAQIANKIDARYPTLTQEELSRVERFNEQKRKSFHDVRNWGVQASPRELGKDGTGIMTGFAGPTDIRRDVQRNNAMIWNEKTREEFGMGKGPEQIRDDRRISSSGKLIPNEFDEAHMKLNKPYDEIQKISEDAQKKLAAIQQVPSGHLTPHVAQQIAMSTTAAQKALIEAGADVNALKQARIDAKNAWATKQTDPAGWYQKYTTAKNQIEDLENKIEAAAKSSGRPELAKQIAESRKTHAKLFAVEQATEAGNVDPARLQALREDGLAVYDEGSTLDKMANFARDHQRDSVSGYRLQPSGPGNMHVQFAGVGLMKDSPKANLWAALDVLGPKPTRAFLLSKGMQDYYAAPRVPAGSQIAQTLARFGTQSLGRQYDPNVQPIILPPAPAR